MPGKMIVIHPDGAMDETEVVRPPTLEEVQKAVGGYVECITMNARWEGTAAEVYCNEEGKLHGLPTNTAATFYVRECCPRFTDVLVGNVVVLAGKAARWV